MVLNPACFKRKFFSVALKAKLRLPSEALLGVGDRQCDCLLLQLSPDFESQWLSRHTSAGIAKHCTAQGVLVATVPLTYLIEALIFRILQIMWAWAFSFCRCKLTNSTALANSYRIVCKGFQLHFALCYFSILNKTQTIIHLLETKVAFC